MEEFDSWISDMRRRMLGKRAEKVEGADVKKSKKRVDFEENESRGVI